MTRTIQELIDDVRDVEERATHHWQNDLAKFFPMSKGPTSTEISMFKSGAASQERIARALEVAVKQRDFWANCFGGSTRSDNDRLIAILEGKE